MNMKYQLTKAQEHFNKPYKYMLTLKYQNHINRAFDKANDDLRHLRNRIHRKLFGRSPWRLLWMPTIEKGDEGRTHIHLYVGEIPSGVKRNSRYRVNGKKDIKQTIQGEKFYIKKYKTYEIGAWFPPELIRNEWELMNQSTISKNDDVRSHIKILDERDDSIGYGTKTFQDGRYNQLLKSINETTDYRYKQDIQKEINKYRDTSLFECLSDTFFVK